MGKKEAIWQGFAMGKKNTHIEHAYTSGRGLQLEKKNMPTLVAEVCNWKKRTHADMDTPVCRVLPWKKDIYRHAYYTSGTVLQWKTRTHTDMDTPVVGFCHGKKDTSRHVYLHLWHSFAMEKKEAIWQGFAMGKKNTQFCNGKQEHIQTWIHLWQGFSMENKNTYRHAYYTSGTVFPLEKETHTDMPRLVAEFFAMERTVFPWKKRHLWHSFSIGKKDRCRHAYASGTDFCQMENRDNTDMHIPSGRGLKDT
jgi:hypothetical protein